MDRNNRFTPYDRQPPRQQHQHQHQQQQQLHQQQPYGQQNNNFRRDDFGGGGGGGGGRRGGHNGGGAMRDQRGRRHNNNNNHNHERFNDNKPYNKRPNRPMGNNFNPKAKLEYQDNSEHYGYDEEDNNRLPAHIESRVAREKPCRTLFVRNVQYTITESEVRELFEKYGEVKEVFNLIENRGMIFITYYDVRAAEEAKQAMQSIFLRDRKIDVHYSLPKEEEEKSRCDRNKNQGTLLYTLKNANSELDDYELQSYFGQFGEVKAIRVPHFKKSVAHHFSHKERNQQRLVEYYDSRACVYAYDSTYDTEYKGGRWDVAFFWDHPYKDRGNSNQKRGDRPFEKERDDNRGGGRRRSDQMRPREYDHYSGGGQNSMREDDRYAPHTSDYPAHHNVDPRLQYNPQMPMQQQQQQQQQPPAIPSAANPDEQRLEQAQKAQQILSMLAHQQQSSPAVQPSSLTAPFQPTNVQSPPIKQEYIPMPPQMGGYTPMIKQEPSVPTTSFVPPVPPTEDQASQVQQLLGLLSQAAQQQQQQQQQQQHQQQQQSALPHQQTQPPPPVAAIPQGVAPIPGMDPATALSQLAALLQQQQQQQQQQQNNQN